MAKDSTTPPDPGVVANSTTPPDPGISLREALTALSSAHLSETDPLRPQAIMVINFLSGDSKS